MYKKLFSLILFVGFAVSYANPQDTAAVLKPLSTEALNRISAVRGVSNAMMNVTLLTLSSIAIQHAYPLMPLLMSAGAGYFGLGSLAFFGLMKSYNNFSALQTMLKEML